MPDENVIESKAGPLEKVGHAVLRKFGPTCPEGGGTLEDQRVLTEEEQTVLKNIVRWTVFRAGLAGALSAIVAACAAMFAEKHYADDFWNYWLVFGGVSLLAAVFEVGFLYFDALRGVHRISAASDVELFPEGEGRSRMAGIMVRAAMELPNPPDRDPYVDPFRSASKWRLLLGALVYKGKVLVTNALAKVLVRKILLRGAARAWLEFVAVPVTAAWNALVCFWVLREARIRAIGPSAVAQRLPEWLGGASAELAEASQRAVGVCVSASRDLHPNHLRMLEWMREHTGVEVTDKADDPELFRESLEKLSESEKQRVLDVLAMAIVIDGKASGRERKIIAGVAGEDQTGRLKSMLHQFRMGHGIQN
ncbi:MAG: hypothetical protein AB8F34_08965 [Akkermansiaceae bacterium]